MRKFLKNFFADHSPMTTNVERRMFNLDVSLMLQRISQEFAAPIGDVSDFRRSVIFPQLYVFVCLILVGTTQEELFAGLFLKLLIVAYLLMAYALIRSQIVILSHTLLGVELLILCGLLCVGASALNLTPLGHVFLPSALLILCLFVVCVSWRLVLVCGVSLFIVLLLYSSAYWLLGSDDGAEMSLGLTLFGSATLAACAISYLRAPREGSSVRGIFPRFAAIDFGWGGARSLESDRLIGEAHDEENELSHLVNNSLQGMMESVEALRVFISAPDRGESARALQHLSELDRALSFVSWTVSDTKVLAELARRTLPARFEAMSYRELKNEIGHYGRCLTSAHAESIEISTPDGEAATFIIAGRDYMLSVLRRLLRHAYRPGRAGGKFNITCRTEPGREVILFHPSSGDSLDDRALVHLEKLVRMSGGDFVHHVDAQGGEIVRCELASALPHVPVEGGLRDWLLLVDDAPQVVAFYERVATALSMKAISAPSRGKAIELLEVYGQPRLVITDMKLADGDALEFIEELRRRFPSTLPILVVSGSSDAAERLCHVAGEIAFLVKPVSRRLLFDAVTNLLAGRGEHI